MTHKEEKWDYEAQEHTAQARVFICPSKLHGINSEFVKDILKFEGEHVFMGYDNLSEIDDSICCYCGNGCPPEEMILTLDKIRED